MKDAAIANIWGFYFCSSENKGYSCRSPGLRNIYIAITLSQEYLIKR